MRRRELVLLIVILGLGAGVRAVALSRSAVEHFDEGVYASNLWFGPPDFAYPLQRFYAPPLLPALIEAGMLAGLAPNLAALLPSFLAGCGTIAAVWWFGRTWFAPEVGLSAAALCALSDSHIAYSAAALTDVLLGLWLVLAVQAIGLSLWRGDLRWAVVGGMFTGLAWWTKYNGWLPLAIEAAALPVLWFFLRPTRQQAGSWLICFAVTALTTAVVWSPYYLSLQAHGGYVPIAANHAKYVVGFAGWLSSAGRQVSNQYAIGVFWSIPGLMLAWFLPSLVSPRPKRESLSQFASSVASVIVVASLTVLFPVAIGAAVGVARMLVAIHRAPRLDAPWQLRLTGLSLTLAWWGGMLVATPLYAPYPRLALPLMIAAWLAAALNWDVPLTASDQSPSARLGSVTKCLFCLAIAGSWLVLAPLLPHADHLWRMSDRLGLMSIAREIRATGGPRQARVIYVFGEPAMLFQLRAAGEEFVMPVQAIPVGSATDRGRPIPTLLIVGPHALRDPVFQQQMASARARWTLVREFPIALSHVVWLDLNDPRRSPQETAPLDRVLVYRLDD
jgi:4-amino-4-deoxy-L-arabinose transferase-like glycosyltransferase